MNPEIKLNAATVSTIDLTYDSTGRVTEEKVTKTGPTVTYDKQYTYDKVSRRLSVKDVTNGNWLETSSFDPSGRLTRITVTSGTGSNPFSWPKGTTNVTCDANGNIVQLVGRNVDTGAIWKVAHQLDYEQRVTRILLNNGDTVDNVYDGMGYRLKEVTTSGGTATTKNLVPIFGNRVIQERDGSDTVTARYYWNNAQFFKKDHSTSSKYFVPEIANSPFTGWNNAGTFNRYDLWDTFGVLKDQSAAGSLSPFQLFANIRVDNAHLTGAPRNSFSYPEIGRMVGGLFALKFQGGGGPCGPCVIFKEGDPCDCPSCPDCMMLLCVICTPAKQRAFGPCCRDHGGGPPPPPPDDRCFVSCSFAEQRREGDWAYGTGCISIECPPGPGGPGFSCKSCDISCWNAYLAYKGPDFAGQAPPCCLGDCRQWIGPSIGPGGGGAVIRRRGPCVSMLLDAGCRVGCTICLPFGTFAHCTECCDNACCGPHASAEKCKAAYFNCPQECKHAEI